MSDLSRGEDFQRAASGFVSKIEFEIGTWDLAVRFVHPSCGWVAVHGALHFVGKADGSLTLSIETPEERSGVGNAVPKRDA